MYDITSLYDRFDIEFLKVPRELLSLINNFFFFFIHDVSCKGKSSIIPASD